MKVNKCVYHRKNKLKRNLLVLFLFVFSNTSFMNARNLNKKTLLETFEATRISFRATATWRGISGINSILH